MSESKLLRWSGLAAILGGLLMIIGSVNWEQPPWRWLGAVGSLLIVFGVIGVYLAQAKDAGLTGFLGFVFLVAGSMFLMGNSDLFGLPYWMLGSLLSAAGLVLLALGTLAARKFPRWVAWLWIASVVLGFPSVFVPAWQTVLGFIASAAVGIAMAGAGYTLWSRPS